MDIDNSTFFIVNQFATALLCLFYIYFVWRDYHVKSETLFIRVSPAIIVPALFSMFGVLFAYFLHHFGIEAFFLAFSFSLALTLSVLDPKYAVSFFVFLLVSRPWEYFNNDLMLSMPRDVFFICALSLIGHKLLRRQFYFEWSWNTAILLGYAVWTFFGAILSAHSSIALHEFSEVFIKGIIAYILIVNVIDRKEAILPMQAALIVAVSEKAAISFYKSLILGEMAEGGRLISVGILENSNDIAAILLLGIPFIALFFKDIGNRGLSVFLGAACSLILVILVWESKSRGAVLSLGALAVATLWVRARNKKIASLVVIFGAIGMIAMLSAVKRDATDLEGSTSNRITYWKAGINMGVRNPLFGVGLAGYNRNLLTYAQGHVGTEGKNKTIHSTWLLPLAESGIPGFVLFCSLWPLAMVGAYRIRKGQPEFFLSLVSYGLAISFLSHTYMLYPYILLAMTNASSKLSHKRTQESYLSKLTLGSQVKVCS